MANVAQRSFAGGELSPALHARTDLVKYATGLRRCRNFIIQKQGGLVNRPGTEFVRALKDSAVAGRLIPFIFNDDQTYLLEFGDQFIRFTQDAGTVVVSGVGAWATATDYVAGDLVVHGGTNYYARTTHTSGATTEPGAGSAWQSSWHALSGSTFEIPTPYRTAELSSIRLVQSEDVITLVHPNHPISDLAREGHTRWTLTPRPLRSRVSTPGTIGVSGGTAGIAYYWAVTAVDEDGVESAHSVVTAALVPSSGTPVILTWDPVPGAVSYRVYRSLDGVTFGYLTTAGGIPANQSDTSWTTDTATVNTMTQGTTTASSDQARNPIVATAAGKPTSGEFNVVGELTFTALPEENLTESLAQVEAWYSRDGEARVSAGIIGTLGSPGVLNIFSPFYVPDNGYATLTIDFTVNVVAGTSPDAVVFDAEFVATSIEFNIGATGFTDTGELPDYSTTPPTFPSVFNAAGKYPGTTTYYQQRQIFANTDDAPQQARASRTGDFGNFGLSTPIQDDDAVSFTLVGRRVSSIQHMLDLDQLLLFTPNGEWVVKGDADGLLLPRAINARQVSYIGCGSLSPLIIGRRVLFVQGRNAGLFDFFRASYDDYDSKDLSIFAAHLFSGYTIEDMDFAQTPNSTVLAVRSDGRVLSLTYVPEHEVWGWSWFDTDGVVENVCVVPEGSEDRVYFIVRRTVDGDTVRYIERMHSRTILDSTATEDLVFMDASVDYEGVPATVISGLTHLEGKEVSVLADGLVVSSPNNPAYPTLTVTAGAITLAVAASKVTVGLPYISDVETLDIDSNQATSLKPDKLQVTRVGISTEKSRGLFVGPALPTGGDVLEDLMPLEFDEEPADTDLTLYTQYVETDVMSEWNVHGRIAIRQVDPLPAGVLSIVSMGFLPGDEFETNDAPAQPESHELQRSGFEDYEADIMPDAPQREPQRSEFADYESDVTTEPDPSPREK